MRLTPRLIAAAALLAACLPATAAERSRVPAPHPAARPAPAGPPHAFLFGSWTGGLFPVPAGSISAASCLATPTVIFTRDVVLRATVTDPVYLQRQIETVRTSPAGAEFRFTHQGATAAAGELEIPQAATQGFGCTDPDALHVERRSENEIVFTGCADFPNSLVRCPSR